MESQLVEGVAVGRPDRRGLPSWFRLVILGLLVVVLVLVMRFTPVLSWLTPENMEVLRSRMGWWAVPAFIVFSAVMIALWVPGSVLMVVGTTVFGTMAAMPINYLGAVAGAVGGFWIARNLAGRAVDELLAPRWPGYRRYRAMLERRGLETLLYLRIVPTPFTAVSYLAGVSPLTAWQHGMATAVGILPGSFALTFLSGTVLEALAAGDWLVVLKPQFWLAVGVYIPTLYLPRLATMARRRWGWFGGDGEEPLPVARVVAEAQILDGTGSGGDGA
jgi:uncharacterized membrane protein YdjX (TVP38/TMEM64 family)